MAANYHTGGSGNDVVTFPKPVGHLNVNVASGVTFSISLDGGHNFITIPSGFYSFPVGPLLEVYINASGAWQLVAIQA